MSRKNGLETSKVFRSTGQMQRLCCQASLASSRPCLNHANHTHDGHGTVCMKDYYGISQKFFERRMVNGWFQENNKSLESTSNFQNWNTPKFGKSAISPWRMLCFARRSVSRLYHLAHLLVNGGLKPSSPNKNAPRFFEACWWLNTRIRGLMMPNVLPGGCKYSSNKCWILVEITNR